MRSPVNREHLLPLSAGSEIRMRCASEIDSRRLPEPLRIEIEKGLHLEWQMLNLKITSGPSDSEYNARDLLR